MIRPAEKLLVTVPEIRPVDLATIYRAHAVEVVRWAARLGGPMLDAEDLMHDVFLVVQRRLPEFRGEAKLTTWLYRITERVVSNARRRERFRRWLRRVRGVEITDALTAAPQQPGAALERDRAMRVVYRALERLPEKYRTPLILFELDGMSGEQIAALLGVRTSTLWVQIHRARSLFLNALETEEA